MTDQKSQILYHALAEAIREASVAGQLIGTDALLARMRAHGLLGDGQRGEPDMEALLAETLATCRDLAALTSISGEIFYHAPSLLSRTYAGILDRKALPVLLIAEEVRRSSAEYPRPLPLDLFQESPFDLTPEQTQACLKTMASDPEFDDISFTTTSTGAVYLFSTRHMELPYATFLAERADTGLLLSP